MFLYLRCMNQLVCLLLFKEQEKKGKDICGVLSEDWGKIVVGPSWSSLRGRGKT